jgi:RNA polymerase sigma-70 factor (ECF subfamily)
LPLDQRVAFVLCDVEERTSGEAAELAGAPEATMRTRLFHARKKLRTALTKEGIQ